MQKDDEPFEEKTVRLVAQLQEQQAEARRLDEVIPTTWQNWVGRLICSNSDSDGKIYRVGVEKVGLTNTEFEAILNDSSKRIDGDIVWQQDEDHSYAVEFRVEVQSDAGWPLVVRGSYNPLIPALSYVLILKTAGRVYALDLGKKHHNPQCVLVGEKHKHRWTERFRDKEAYVPGDITAPASDPVAVWKQFCTEANIHHTGVLHAPPPWQRRFFL